MAGLAMEVPPFLKWKSTGSEVYLKAWHYAHNAEVGQLTGGEMFVSPGAIKSGFCTPILLGPLLLEAAILPLGSGEALKVPNIIDVLIAVDVIANGDDRGQAGPGAHHALV